MFRFSLCSRSSAARDIVNLKAQVVSVFINIIIIVVTIMYYHFRSRHR